MVREYVDQLYQPAASPCGGSPRQLPPSQGCRLETAVRHAWPGCASNTSSVDERTPAGRRGAGGARHPGPGQARPGRRAEVVRDSSTTTTGDQQPRPNSCRCPPRTWSPAVRFGRTVTGRAGTCGYTVPPPTAPAPHPSRRSRDGRSRTTMVSAPSCRTDQDTAPQRQAGAATWCGTRRLSPGQAAAALEPPAPSTIAAEKGRKRPQPATAAGESCVDPWAGSGAPRSGRVARRRPAAIISRQHNQATGAPLALRCGTAADPTTDRNASEGSGKEPPPAWSRAPVLLVRVIAAGVRLVRARDREGT